MGDFYTHDGLDVWRPCGECEECGEGEMCRDMRVERPIEVYFNVTFQRVTQKVGVYAYDAGGPCVMTPDEARELAAALVEAAMLAEGRAAFVDGEVMREVGRG